VVAMVGDRISPRKRVVPSPHAEHLWVFCPFLMQKPTCKSIVPALAVAWSVLGLGFATIETLSCKDIRGTTENQWFDLKISKGEDSHLHCPTV